MWIEVVMLGNTVEGQVAVQPWGGGKKAEEFTVAYRKFGY